MSSRRLALALVLAPGLALAQADAPESSTPQDEINERRAPNPDVVPSPEGGAGGPAGQGPMAGNMPPQGTDGGPMAAQDMPRGPMGGHHGQMMRMHHPEMRWRTDDGRAHISVRIGDRHLTIACGETPISDCVEGAGPLLELLR